MPADAADLGPRLARVLQVLDAQPERRQEAVDEHMPACGISATSGRARPDPRHGQQAKRPQPDGSLACGGPLGGRPCHAAFLQGKIPGATLLKGPLVQAKDVFGGAPARQSVRRLFAGRTVQISDPLLGNVLVRRASVDVDGLFVWGFNPEVSGKLLRTVRHARKRGRVGAGLLASKL